MVLKKNKTGKIWIIQDQKIFYFLPFFFLMLWAYTRNVILFHFVLVDG